MPNFIGITTPLTEHAEETTWLELFFDLVYVAILVVLGDRLSHDLTLQGVIEFALVFHPYLAVVAGTGILQPPIPH